MVDYKLSEQLTELNFIKIDSNANGIYLFYKIIQEEAHIVSIMRINYGVALTVDQYEHILAQIKNNFINRGFGTVKILSLIFTEEPQKVRQLCVDEFDHWIVDTGNYNLIIYENQSSDFLGLKDILEKILEEEHIMRMQQEGNLDLDQANIGMKQWITPVNSVIVLINIIVYVMINFIINHTGYFGGAEKIVRQGALAYKQVINNHEYYRILTSMFLHADFDHIFNNMLVLLFVGANLEKAAGKLRYLIIYFGTGIIAGFSSIGYNMWKEDKVYGIGASGAIFGVVGAILLILIVNKGRLLNISSRQMIIFAVLSLYGGFVNVGVDNVAHIGGFIGGLLIALIIYMGSKKDKNDMNESLG